MLASGARPTHQREGHSRDIERAKNALVVLGQPKRKIDIEVLPALIRVQCRDRRKWTALPVEQEHDHFYSDGGSEACRCTVVIPP